MPRRVLVVGLDCVPPALAFEHLADELPVLSRLRARGTAARLRSTVPPITVPAWASMTSGRDPGELGLYGFRNRRRGDYGLELATSADVRAPRLWDLLGNAGRTSVVIGVPPTAPPVPVRGTLVSCLLHPGADVPWTFPVRAGAELQAAFGPWRFDVEGYRGLAPDALIDAISEMTRQRFAAAAHLWRTRTPDFLMMVDMGPDRLHHACWHHLDPTDLRHEPGHPLVDAARGYYRLVDRCLGELLDAAGAPRDDVAVLVVSDHGARPLRGGVHVNEWLRDEGLLVLRHGDPDPPRPLRPDDVDWPRTRAWAEGGYHARICLNVRGREPEGVLSPAEAEMLRDRLEERLHAMPGPDGRPLGNVVRRPEETFRRVRGLPPDLLVFLGDLEYRALATVGTGTLFAEANDTGPDACNHDWDGIVVAAGGGVPTGGDVHRSLPIAGVTPTVLALLGVPAPTDLAAESFFPAPLGVAGPGGPGGSA